MSLHHDINKIRLSLATSSYPVLKSINYFRDYNNYVENSLKESISEVRNFPIEKECEGNSILINPEIIKQLADEKMYDEFGSIMRESLFIALYSFIEKVVTKSCVVEGRAGRYRSYKDEENNIKDKSLINIAKEFLINKEGLFDISNISGWDYIDDMRKIRNRFVHHGGASIHTINNMASKYDFFVKDNQVILGENFTLDFLGIIESFSVEFAKVVYPDESEIYALFRNILNQNK